MSKEKQQIKEDPKYDWGPENDNLNFKQYEHMTIEELDVEIEKGFAELRKDIEQQKAKK